MTFGVKRDIQMTDVEPDNQQLSYYTSLSVGVLCGCRMRQGQEIQKDHQHLSYYTSLSVGILCGM